MQIDVKIIPVDGAEEPFFLLSLANRDTSAQDVQSVTFGSTHSLSSAVGAIMQQLVSVFDSDRFATVHDFAQHACDLVLSVSGGAYASLSDVEWHSDGEFEQRLLAFSSSSKADADRKFLRMYGMDADDLRKYVFPNGVAPYNVSVQTGALLFFLLSRLLF